MQITDILDNVSKVIVGKEEVTKKVITSRWTYSFRRCSRYG